MQNLETILKTFEFSSFDLTVQSLDLKNKSKALLFNEPFYRGDIWEVERKTALIESILLKMPISPIWFQQIQTGETWINSYIIPIDGSQRLQTAFQFYNNKFTLKGCKLYPDLEGKCFQDLPIKLQTAIEDYSFRSYILRPNTNQKLINELYKRLATGGVSISKKDIKKALKILKNK